MTPTHRQWTRHDITKGDQVKIRGRWYTVTATNAKTVSVEMDHSWTGKTPYRDIQGHHPVLQARDPWVSSEAPDLTRYRFDDGRVRGAVWQNPDEGFWRGVIDDGTRTWGFTMAVASLDEAQQGLEARISDPLYQEPDTVPGELGTAGSHDAASVLWDRPHQPNLGADGMGTGL